jgi:hypothetical protein
MYEEWIRTRRNARAVNRGRAITGRTITALAIILSEWLNRRLSRLDIEGEVITPSGPEDASATA